MGTGRGIQDIKHPKPVLIDPMEKIKEIETNYTFIENGIDVVIMKGVEIEELRLNNETTIEEMLKKSRFKPDKVLKKNGFNFEEVSLKDTIEKIIYIIPFLGEK